MSKPSIPSGTRDFSADTVRKRQYIFNTIRSVFETYGFQPLETPAMENLDTLMGKYGEEGDKLIFKILNNGLADPKNKDKAAIAFSDKILHGLNSKDITERALRYDLSIPFARYVAMNHTLLTLPYKRYQMQPVWRADRPQKGRYREFYQCDADVVGSLSLLNEVELTAMYAAVFQRLGIPVEIRLNSRKLLLALAETCGGADKMMDITIAIDKLDKIGMDKVKEEILQRGLNESQWNIIEKFLQVSMGSGEANKTIPRTAADDVSGAANVAVSGAANVVASGAANVAASGAENIAVSGAANAAGSNADKLAAIALLLGDNAEAKKGLAELQFVLDHAAPDNVVLDFTLARGLNYYTGIIFEVKASGVQMGSIGGGGRYDDLTGLFGVPNIPGVGISFGVDRIYDVMEELDLFPAAVQTGTEVLFFNLGAVESKAAFLLAQQFRLAGINTELFHEKSKLDKQFKYAEKKNIPFIVIVGSEEMTSQVIVVKQLESGQQKTIPRSALTTDKLSKGFAAFWQGLSG